MPDLFDIIGPVMIGPSSSHTAGAARIGKTARMLLGTTPAKASIGLCGSFQKTFQGHGTDKALIGGLLGMEIDDPRLRDSQTVADAVGFQVDFYSASVKGSHPNTVIIDVSDAKGRSVNLRAASIGGGEIRVQAVDGHETRITGHANTLVIHYLDKYGMIANITRQIAAAQINIAAMLVSRTAAGGDAMVALEIDGRAEPALTETLSGLENVYSVSYLAFTHDYE
ncbi:MAG TPA: L-serine ammonia-lyase, iron-sulfur-dependent subunit beta [Candidatus Limiplasma sp.]|nr:L-serine ammonia-lyase, iron-sulfur-dependent subunit beta [Candidatus Limiplasma sp.]HRX08998.1 L-serine ammonia-lyase, iron-sulfur-dependent subunit beta [Candidatus Limiplasma sp.]